MKNKTSYDAQTYEQSRLYLKGALEHLLASGQSLRDLFDLVFDKFGEGFLPYLLQFFQDIREGRIHIAGMGESARDAVLGHHVTPEQRVRMIQEAAYYKSEKHGFASASERDWAEAEKEVDAHLDGLIVKGSAFLASLTAALEEGMNTSQREISQWLDEKNRTRTKMTDTTKKTTGAKPASKIDNRKKSVKASPGAKVVKKKAVKKKSAKKKVVKKKTTKTKSV